MDPLSELFDVLAELVESRDRTRATSIRQPIALHRAAQLAAGLGMDKSLTAAANHALEERIRSFARQEAIAAHLERFPADQPPLSAVVLRRAAGSGHPATQHPDLVEAVANWIERREPAWVRTAADDTVDRVLDYVEMLASGVGVDPVGAA